jgi:hypothetical protein
MSTDRAAAGPAAAALDIDVLAGTRHALRIAVGAALAFTLAEALGWTASFLPAALTVTLLSGVRACPPFATGLGMIATMAAASLLALLVVKMLAGYPVVLAGVIMLVTYAAFHLIAKGRAAFVATVLLVAITVIPVIALISPALAVEVARVLVWAGATAVAIVWLMHTVFPAPAAVVPALVRETAPPDSGRGATLVALASTLTVLPVILAFLFLNLAHALPTLVFTVMIVRQQNFERSIRNAQGLLLGTVIGGVIAMAVYAVLAAAPMLPVLFLVMLLIGLGFGRTIAAGGRWSVLCPFMFNTVIILLGSSIAPTSDPASAFYGRFVYILLAAVFAVGLMSLFWPLTARRRRPA